MEQLPNIMGNKINLRPITMADTNYIVEWRNNPRVRDNFIFREKFSYEMHEHWMKTKVENGSVIQYIIEESATTKPIGSVYYGNVNYNYKSAEFGIFIGDDTAIGKGYARESTRRFIKFGFNQVGLHRIFLRVLEKNVIAYKGYLSAGFKVEGTARDMVFIDGEFLNVIFMSIIKEDL